MDTPKKCSVLYRGEKKCSSWASYTSSGSTLIQQPPENAKKATTVYSIKPNMNCIAHQNRYLGLHV